MDGVVGVLERLDVVVLVDEPHRADERARKRG
jgi:hypothetical protein